MGVLVTMGNGLITVILNAFFKQKTKTRPIEKKEITIELFAKSLFGGDFFINQLLKELF